MNTNTDGVSAMSAELDSLMRMREDEIDAELRALGIDPETAARKAGDAIDRAVIRSAGYVCGMCGRSTAHEHTPEEVVIFRNGIKRGRMPPNTERSGAERPAGAPSSQATDTK